MQQKYGVSNNWFQISMNFDTKNSYHCLMQYKKQTDNNIKKGKWTLSEDLQLIISYKVYGDKNWALISKSVPNRTDVQCRERFWNILDPRINHSEWTQEEDERLKRAYEQHPDKWSKIALMVGSRTDNQCSRRWNKIHGKKRTNTKRPRKPSKVERPTVMEITEESKENKEKGSDKKRVKKLERKGNDDKQLVKTKSVKKKTVGYDNEKVFSIQKLSNY